MKMNDFAAPLCQKNEELNQKAKNEEPAIKQISAGVREGIEEVKQIKAGKKQYP